MSAVLGVLPPIPMPILQHLGLRARLARVERVIDERFTCAASLRLDRAVLAYEAARTRSTTRGWRRAA